MEAQIGDSSLRPRANSFLPLPKTFIDPSLLEEEVMLTNMTLRSTQKDDFREGKFKRRTTVKVKYVRAKTSARHAKLSHLRWGACSFLWCISLEN